jgi:glycosidase
MKVYLDFVAYGISEDTVWFKSALGKPDSQYASWFAFTNPEHTAYQKHSYTTWNGAPVGFIHWNLADAGPVGLVTMWGKKWLDPDSNGDTRDGVDGYRLDHVYSSAPEGWGATIAFWQTWATALRATKPDVFIFGEPGDWKNLGTDLLTPTGFDAAIAKPFEFAARDALKSESAAGLYAAMDATIAAVPGGKTLVVEVNDHDSDRIASVVGGSIARSKLAAAILLTQPFPPSIYSGDEIGMRGVKANYGGDANDIPMREPFKWNAVAGPPMSNYFHLHARAYEHRVEQDHDGRSVEEQNGVNGSLLEEYKKLIAARKNNTALRRGRYSVVPAASPHIWSFLRSDQHSSQTVLVAINLSDQTVVTTLDLSRTTIQDGAATPSDVFAGPALTPITSDNKRAYPITLQPSSYRILAVKLAPSPSHP